MANDPTYERPEGQEISTTTPNAGTLAILAQSEHAALIESANRRPRKLAEFRNELQSYATHTQRVAEQMFYTLKRNEAGGGQKLILGPSVRFAEIMVPCWRNCAAGARPLDDAAETVAAQGVFVDYERHIRVTEEAVRRITTKEGRRYSGDMIVVTMNAAKSIAYRNAVCRGIPRALWDEAYQAAMLTAGGKDKSLSQAIADGIQAVSAKFKVTDKQILDLFGHADVREMTVEDLAAMRVIYRELSEGEKTLEEVFGSPFEDEIAMLMKQLRKTRQQEEMLRNSHRGRTEELLRYLRSQVAQDGQGKAEPEPHQQQQPAEQPRQEEAPAQEKREEPPEDKEPESAAPTSAPEPEIPRGRPGPKPGTRKAREEAARTSAVNPFPDIPPEATTTAAPQEQQPAAQPQTKSQNLFRF